MAASDGAIGWGAAVDGGLTGTLIEAGTPPCPCPLRPLRPPRPLGASRPLPPPLGGALPLPLPVLASPLPLPLPLPLCSLMS